MMPRWFWVAGIATCATFAIWLAVVPWVRSTRAHQTYMRDVAACAARGHAYFVRHPAPENGIAPTSLDSLSDYLAAVCGRDPARY